MAGNSRKSGHGAKSERSRETAIAALLTCPTINAAAQKASVSEATLLRWLKETEFRAAYAEARRQALEMAISGLQNLCGEAAQTLASIMRDAQAPASARISAARSIFENALKGAELLDVEERLTALETLMEQQKEGSE